MLRIHGNIRTEGIVFNLEKKQIDQSQIQTTDSSLQHKSTTAWATQFTSTLRYVNRCLTQPFT